MAPNLALVPKTSQIRYVAPPLTSPWLRAYAWITASLYCGLFVAVPLVSIGLLVGAILAPVAVGPWALAWLSLSFLPASRWDGFRIWFCKHITCYWESLFELSIVVVGELPPQTPTGYLLGVSPHGIVPLGGTLYLSYCSNMTPGVYGSTCAASVVLRMPVLRQLFTWLGMCDASASTMLKQLKTRNVAVLPGGIAELMLCSPDQEQIYITKRFGIAKVAHQAGVVLVPAYCFGNTRHFSQLATSRGCLSRLSRRLRTSFTMFWGQYGLPIPRWGRVTMVFGEPIKPSADPKATMVEYIAALKSLYYAHRDFAGYEGVELHVH